MAVARIIHVYPDGGSDTFEAEFDQMFEGAMPECVEAVLRMFDDVVAE